MLVDELWAPLVVHLWGAGCSTEFSCQGDAAEFAHVVFRDARSLHTALTALLVLALRSGDTTLQPRLARRGSPFCTTMDPTSGIHYDIADQWGIDAWPKPGFEWQFEDPFGHLDPLYYRVSFPHRDLLTLTSALG